MRAVILVGGEGTRLRPLTNTTPKQLLRVAEVPMLERLLAWLAGHGVDSAVLSLGYRPDAFVSAYPDGTAAGVQLEYAIETEPLDTAGAVAFAARHAALEEPFLVVNGDVLTDIDVGALVSFHRERGSLATIALTPVDDPSRFGVVHTDSEGRVLAFIEKPAPGTAPSNLVNAGIYLLDPRVLDLVPAGRRVSIERETFPALVEAGTLSALASSAYWLDTGTPEAFLRAQRDLLGGRRGSAPAPGATAGAPGVWTLGSARLDGEVLPPVLLGDAAVLEGGAKVRSSVIGAGATVACGATVEDAALFPGAFVGPGAVVRSSIVGCDAVIEEGAVVEGLSVVGDGERVGAGIELSGAKVPPEPRR